jgi:hypothetical protein
MASNRSTLDTRPTAARPGAGQTPREALAAVARQGTRVQLAALSAAEQAFAAWAQASGRLAQAVGDELLQRVDGETDSRELIVGVAEAAHAHLHDLAALPSAAANQFDARLARVSIDR